MSAPADAYVGAPPLRPRPLAVLAVVESVACGLVARHALDEGPPSAAMLVVIILFLLPAVVGYRTVAASDRRQLGVLPPPVILLMMLAAGVALGGAGVLGTLLLMPVFMLMAFWGGMLALMVRGVCNTALRVAKRNRARRGTGPRQAWSRVIIRTPL